MASSVGDACFDEHLRLGGRPDAVRRLDHVSTCIRALVLSNSYSFGWQDRACTLVNAFRLCCSHLVCRCEFFSGPVSNSNCLLTVALHATTRGAMHQLHLCRVLATQGRPGAVMPQPGRCASGAEGSFRSADATNSTLTLASPWSRVESSQ
jgi:hypothetical protein